MTYTITFRHEAARYYTDHGNTVTLKGTPEFHEFVRVHVDEFGAEDDILSIEVNATGAL